MMVLSGRFSCGITRGVEVKGKKKLTEFSHVKNAYFYLRELLTIIVHVSMHSDRTSCQVCPSVFLRSPSQPSLPFAELMSSDSLSRASTKLKTSENSSCVVDLIHILEDWSCLNVKT